MNRRKHINVIDAAKRQGAKHVGVYTFADPDLESPLSYMPMYIATEEYLKASGLGYSIMRNTIYADLLQMCAELAIETGELGLPLGEGKVAFITRDDVVQAGTAILSTPDIDPASIYETNSTTSPAVRPCI